MWITFEIRRTECIVLTELLMLVEALVNIRLIKFITNDFDVTLY